MMRSLYSAVSGLQNHQTRMDVIGNNVANVNTTGFKKGRVTFQDIISQMLQGAARPNEQRGGVNAKQVGLGMNIASIDNLMTQGSLQTTGKNTDLAIMGEGFFVTQDGDKTLYTRNGNFLVDRDGTLVTTGGLRVQGWTPTILPDGTELINTADPVGDLEIVLGEKIAAQPTQLVRLKSNLNMNTPILGANPTPAELLQNTHTTSIQVFDTYGDPRTLTLQFQKDALNQWTMTATMVDQNNVAVNNLQLSVNAVKADTDNQLTLAFNTDGTLLSAQEPAGAAQELINAGNLQTQLSYTHPDGTVQTFALDLGTVGDVTASLTQFEGPTTSKAYQQDGNAMGYLNAYQIDSSGTITGSYTNGARRSLGQVALATFTNPMGLEKTGESFYTESNNSGNAALTEANAIGAGSILAGTLEMSNVDLSETFTDMIVTERGFQANSRVVTTSDEMLQEVLNLKR